MNGEYEYEEKFQEALKDVKSNSLKHKLVAIKNIVVRRLAVERQFKAEHNKLEAKYDELYKPIYEKRRQVIEGSAPVNVDEIKEKLAKLSLKTESSTSTETGIPDFWLKCLKNTAQFGFLINKKDEKILSHLQDINYESKENGNFTLNFVFTPNTYFNETVLKREFLLDDKLAISKIVSTEINWKSDEVNPTVEQVKKKVKNSKCSIVIFRKNKRSKDNYKERRS